MRLPSLWAEIPKRKKRKKKEKENKGIKEQTFTSITIKPSDLLDGIFYCFQA